mgnify:CR=1 FL=1
MDAYKVLGLTEGATEEEIKTAYRALAQKYNPDNYEAGPLREEAEAKMTELNEAFDALMGAIRTGTPVNSRRTANAGEPEPDTGAAANGRYRAIRQMINSGAVEQALEAADEELLVDDHYDARQQQLDQTHGNVVAVEPVGERPAPHHVAHREIHQHRQKDQ